MTLKKLLLSLGVIICFVGYMFVTRHSDDTASVRLPTSSLSNPSSNTGVPQQQAVPNQQNTAPGSSASSYKDGTYTGSVTDAFYGNVQVRVTISGGQITDVSFLQYPNDRSTSRMINGQAMPLLRQEAIQAQSAQVDGVSGATDTSYAFIQSLAAALNQAKNA